MRELRNVTSTFALFGLTRFGTQKTQIAPPISQREIRTYAKSAKVEVTKCYVLGTSRHTFRPQEAIAASRPAQVTIAQGSRGKSLAVRLLKQSLVRASHDRF